MPSDSREPGWDANALPFGPAPDRCPHCFEAEGDPHQTNCNELRDLTRGPS